MSRSTAPNIEPAKSRVAFTERAFDAHVSPAPDRREGERSTALRLLTHPLTDEPTAAAANTIALPLLATAGDVREVVQYLKRKPAGVSIVEALDDFRKRVFEPRKVAAYEFWGIIAREGDRLQLSPLGWEFARKLEPEAEAYRVILNNTAPYRSALEWIHAQQPDVVTHAAVAAFWQELYCAALGHNEKTVEGNVICFFHLCQAAELGMMTIGKRGQPARLRVERAELSNYIEGRAAPSRAQAANADAETKLFPAPAARLHTADQDEPHASPTGDVLHVFISSGKDAQVVAQVQTALEFAGIKSHIVRRGVPEESPVTGVAFETMRRCEAALVVVTPDDCTTDEAGQPVLDQNLLVEIGAAFVHYDRRVALLWDERLPMPLNLRALPHFKFTDNALTWDAGVGLLKAIKDFQERARNQER